LIAHELAHSWSGNLVTNSTWNDFWLNEGFTVYFEERIMEEIYGKEVADILAEIEFFEMQQEMKEISSGDHPEDTKLHLKLKNRNPDDGMTQIAYVKGAFFLKTLEAKVGREKLDEFLNSYFESFKFKTINSKQFESILQERLLDPNKIKFNYKEWIYEEGLPKNCVKIESKRLQNMTELAQNFSAGQSVFEPKIHYVYQKIKGKRKKKKIKVVEQIKRDDFIVQEWQVFIRNLDDKITVDQLNKADNAMHFSTWNNSEILTEWLVLNIQKGNTAKLKSEIKKFISKVGRRKYLMPIYRALSQNPADKKWAKEVFDGCKSNYHAVSKNSIEQVLK
jgi:aminopeptidase N